MRWTPAPAPLPPVPDGRLLTVELDGGLRSLHGDHRSIMPDELYAVVVLWEPEPSSAWLGWLTTMRRTSVCFSEADLVAPAFGCWLLELPGWDPGKMWLARTCRGLHLVWRCPPDLR